MYLLQIDTFTGLVKEDPELDGFMAVPSFRELYNKEGYGIKAITCVALYMDYGSIIKRYNDKERAEKAMEMVYDNRKAILWNSDEIQLALINYKELQYDKTLEEKKILDQMHLEKLSEIKDSESSYDKTVKMKELTQINNLMDSFDAKNQGKDLFKESPVRNGYTLQRLEILLTDKKSFYYEREERERKFKEKQSASAKENSAGN